MVWTLDDVIAACAAARAQQHAECVRLLRETIIADPKTKHYWADWLEQQKPAKT